MPYVSKVERIRFEEALDIIRNNVDFNGITPGQLNYLVTMLTDIYLKYKGLNYTHINDVMGALEGAKLEFYRRVASGYEDQKIQYNGDVYDSETNTGCSPSVCADCSCGKASR